LVTQRYHLPRALHLCRGLGIDAVGYVADRQSYVRILAYWVREIPALWLSWWDLRIRHPIPILGSPIPILEEDNGTNP
jgi:vancomycin permeability regulator SanA